MAQARSYFEKAAKLQEKAGRAHIALSTIRELFMIEREVKALSHEQRFWIRRQRAFPILRGLCSQATPWRAGPVETVDSTKDTSAAC